MAVRVHGRGFFCLGLSFPLCEVGMRDAQSQGCVGKLLLLLSFPAGTLFWGSVRWVGAVLHWGSPLVGMQEIWNQGAKSSGCALLPVTPEPGVPGKPLCWLMPEPPSGISPSWEGPSGLRRLSGTQLLAPWGHGWQEGGIGLRGKGQGDGIGVHCLVGSTAG